VGVDEGGDVVERGAGGVEEVPGDDFHGAGARARRKDVSAAFFEKKAGKKL
jgi:hypothetical protein